MKQKSEPFFWATGLRPDNALGMLAVTGSIFLGVLAALRVLGLA